MRAACRCGSITDMQTTKDSNQPAARPGDRLVARGLPGYETRHGEIIEVLGAPGHVHYRVRWDDEHESLFFPASDGVHVVHPPDPGPDAA